MLCVINSLKHAFPDGFDRGSIKVSFQATPEGWTLAVGDDGVGLSSDHAGVKPGLGTGFVNALAGQLSATVSVTDADPGTLVSVSHNAAG